MEGVQSVRHCDVLSGRWRRSCATGAGCSGTELSLFHRICALFVSPHRTASHGEGGHSTSAQHDSPTPTLEEPCSTRISIVGCGTSCAFASAPLLFTNPYSREFRKAHSPPGASVRPPLQLNMAAAVRTVVCVARPQGQQAPQPRGVAARAVSFPAQPHHIANFAAQSGQAQRLQEGPSCPWPSTSPHSEGQAATGVPARGVWALFTGSQVSRRLWERVREAQGAKGFCRRYDSAQSNVRSSAGLGGCDAHARSLLSFWN